VVSYTFQPLVDSIQLFIVLQAQFAQARAPGPLSPTTHSMGYHPGPPRLGHQQLYYGQGTPGLIPPQPAGFGFQQQVIPGFRSGVAPNFMMPPYQLQRQGQLGPQMGIRRGGPPHQQQVFQQQPLQVLFLFFVSFPSIFSFTFIFLENTIHLPLQTLSTHDHPMGG